MRAFIIIGFCALILPAAGWAKNYEDLPADQPVHCPFKLALDEGKYDFAGAELVGGQKPLLKPVAPDRDGKWNLEDFRPTTHTFELVCHFEDTDSTVTIPIPRNMYLCAPDGEDIVCR